MNHRFVVLLALTLGVASCSQDEQLIGPREHVRVTASADAYSDYQAGMRRAKSDMDHYYTSLTYACGGHTGTDSTQFEPSDPTFNDPNGPTGPSHGGAVSTRCWYAGGRDTMEQMMSDAKANARQKYDEAVGNGDFDEADFWEGFIEGVNEYIVRM